MKYATKKVTKITEHLLDAAVIGITDMGNMDREKLLVVIKKVLRRCAQYAHSVRTLSLDARVFSYTHAREYYPRRPKYLDNHLSSHMPHAGFNRPHMTPPVLEKPALPQQERSWVVSILLWGFLRMVT